MPATAQRFSSSTGYVRCATATPSPCFAGARDLADFVYGCPSELQEEFFQRAGIVTEFLHGRLRSLEGLRKRSKRCSRNDSADGSIGVGELSDTEVELLWVECFALDLVGAVPRLPRPRTPLHWQRLLIHSAEMLAAASKLPGLGVSPNCFTALRPMHEFAAVADEMVMQACRLAPLAGRIVFRFLQRMHSHSLHVDQRAAASAVSPPDSSIAALLCLAAAGTGQHAYVAQIIQLNKIPSVYTRQSACLAASLDHWPAVMELCSVSQDAGRLAMAHATRSGSIELLQRICAIHPDAIASVPLQDLISQQHLNATTTWMLSTTSLSSAPSVRDIRNLSIAARNIEILAFAQANGIGTPVSPKRFAHDLDALRMIHKYATDVVWTHEVMEHAGSREIIQFLHENRLGGTLSSAMRGAIAHDRFELASWLYQDFGIPFPLDALDVVAQRGNAAHVSLLVASGCSCTKFETYLTVAERGYSEIASILFDADPGAAWRAVEQCARDAGQPDTADAILKCMQRLAASGVPVTPCNRF